MPRFLETLISGLAHVPPRGGPTIAGAPHEPTTAASLGILTVLVTAATLLLLATLAAI